MIKLIVFKDKEVFNLFISLPYDMNAAKEREQLSILKSIF